MMKQSRFSDYLSSASSPLFFACCGAILLAALSSFGLQAQSDATPRFRHVGTGTEQTTREVMTRRNDEIRHLSREVQTSREELHMLEKEVEEVDSMLPRNVEQILAELPASYPYMRYALRAAGPWVISGYRPINSYSLDIPKVGLKEILEDAYTTHWTDTIVPGERYHSPEVAGQIAEVKSNGVYFGDEEEQPLSMNEDEYADAIPEDEKTQLPPVARGEYMPAWLREAYINRRIQEDMMYKMMVNDPYRIEYAYWDLPVPPRLPEEDRTFSGFVKRLNLPDVDLEKAVINSEGPGRYNWLHTINAGLQFSQAYMSRNWYQGGNNYVSALLNLLWEVNLNQVYHPNLMLQSVLSYKLGISTTPKSSLHRYQINTDLFQYNLKGGLKAFKSKWYYSFTLLFKTQLLLNRADDSDIHKASFLSPGEMNLGLGMTYNHQNEKKTFKLSLSISPLAYNLKTCINKFIDPTQFNIKPGRKTLSEVGSNIECNTEWRMGSNVFWRSRLFAFSDYSSLLGDWENTFEFTINRFLSTQLYFHLRYDSATPLTYGTRWGKWQFKEILSFGLSYTFSTKP